MQFVLDIEPADLACRTLHRMNTSLKFSPFSVLSTAELKKYKTRSPAQVIQDSEREAKLHCIFKNHVRLHIII